MRNAAGHDEGGYALFYSLLVVLVVGGIVAVTLAAATGELRQSAFELDFEDTVHVAEAGIELQVAELVIENDTDDGIAGPALGESEYDWAIAAATRQTVPGTYDLPAIDMGEGEAVGIRPSGSSAEFVYGVGFTPSRDAFVNGAGDPYARVVKVQIGFTSTDVAGDDALLVDGGVRDNGNSWAVTGSNGTIHANGTNEISNDNTEGGITYSGDCPDPCVGTGPVSEKPVPDLTIEDVWETDDAEAIAAVGDWFDYCSGTWYQRQPGDTVPCTGTALLGDPPGSNWHTNATRFRWSSTALGTPGHVYWFDDARDVELYGGGHLSVLSRGDITFQTSAGEVFEVRYPGLLAFTEGDLTLSGNAAMADPDDGALAYARGTVHFSGTISSTGIAYIAKDADFSTTIVQGNGAISYNGGGIADLGGEATPLYLEWEEVLQG